MQNWCLIRFPRINLHSPLKYLMCFLVGINTKSFLNILEEKHFAPLRIPNLFIKSFFNPFVDIALTFIDSSFNSFLFEVTFLFKFFSLSSKSVICLLKQQYHSCLLNLIVLILQQNFLPLTY